MTATFVFLGPSLPRAEAERRLPGAVFLPPAAAGDITRLVAGRRRGRLALVDGYFERMAAPWHKELLFARERGWAVYGAASMGALRAAELAPFGMIGVGRVAAAFARGELTRDDEVAVAHLPASHGFRPVSDALVNLRAGLAAARVAGAISARSERTLVTAAQARFYRERSWAELGHDGAALGVPARQLAALAAFVARTKPDAKAADTRLLLARLRRTAAAPLPPRPADWRLARTWFWEQFRSSL